MNDEMVYEEPLDQFLRRKLTESGLNQRQAALRMGVSWGMVNAWLQPKGVPNHRHPNPGNVERLATLLEVDPDELMIRAGHRTRREADLHPKQAELLELARQLPLAEADMAIDYMRWRLDRS